MARDCEGGMRSGRHRGSRTRPVCNCQFQNTSSAIATLFPICYLCQLKHLDMNAIVLGKYVRRTSFMIKLNEKTDCCCCVRLHAAFGLRPDEDRIVSHDAPRFTLHFHCVRDISLSVIFSTREMNITVLDVDGSKHVSVQQLLLLRVSSWLIFAML